MTTIQKITPNLWFDGQAEEAARFYVSIFRDAEIRRVSHYGPNAPMPEGTALTVEFTLEGQTFTALNGGPQFSFTPAISFVVSCETQDEVDHYWDRLSEGGDPQAQMCGWLKDKFGLSWQVFPGRLLEMLRDPDRAKADRAMSAMLTMKKIDVATIDRAYAGK